MASINIRASYTVIPNEPTPKGRLWLSNNDHATRLGHTPLICIFKAKHNHQNVIERMRISLSQILVHFYPLAGRLWCSESGRIEIDCNAKGVTLLEAETTKTLQDYGDFAPTESIKELVPKIDYVAQPIWEIPLLLVQLTRFNEGGLAIGIAFSHPVGDGVSFANFMNSWAKVARGEALDSHDMPFLDRTLLKFSDIPKFDFDHPELKPPPLKLGASSSIDEQKKETCAEILKLTHEQVEMLKTMAANNNETPKGLIRPYSTFEAIAAHIWRCASKARKLDENQPTIVRFNADIRARLIPSLPENYFGNGLVATVTPKCYVGEILSNPLGYVAQKIREAIGMVTNEFIRSQSSVMVGREQLDCIKAFFLGKGELMNAPFCGNPNLHITSWMGMSVYEADFGWGKPMHFGLAYVCSFDRAVVLLSPDGDGSVHVSMHFQTLHMQLFKKFFYEIGFTTPPSAL